MRAAVVDAVRQPRVVGIGSPRASLQSNYALKELVGKDNFYHGVSEGEHALAHLALEILQKNPQRIVSMKSVESADAIFILGDDLTNTAPMMALAVRQAVRNKPKEAADQAKIPGWHDAAVRELVQEEKGPLFIADVLPTKLADVATGVFTGSPDDVARLGYAVAHVLDPEAPPVQGLSAEDSSLAQQIATALAGAKKPVIITGTSSGQAHAIHASSNVLLALHKKNKDAGIVITQAECNSLGLAMMGGKSLKDAFNAGSVDTLVVLENDLYRHDSTAAVDAFMKQCNQVVVLDHANTTTVQKAHLVIPAGAFAESDGILVNNEGRAQRFFQVYETKSDIQESWRWLAVVGAEAGKGRMAEWKNFESVTHAMVSSEPLLHGAAMVTPSSDYRVEGQRIPRAPHRYSGRTAMTADIAVSEPKPPEDPDSSMSYTMEGFRGQPPSSMIPFYWSPGWNSVQSVNKYQEEVGAALRGGDPGLKLIVALGQHGAPHYFKDIPEKFKPEAGRLRIARLHHIFGSEELSARSASVAQRIQMPYVMVNTADAVGLTEGQLVSVSWNGSEARLPVRLNPSFPKGVMGLPAGMTSVAGEEAWGIISNVKE